MSFALSQLARRLWTDEARLREEFKCPFLTWESSERDHNEETWLGTQTGAPELVPRVGEPLVFPLIKGPSLANAFGMGVTVGRTANNDIVLHDQSVSRFHGFFQLDAKTGVWKLHDADSKNGTWATGLKVEAKNPVALTSGALLRFGDVQMVYRSADDFFAFLRETVSPRQSASVETKR
jgi:hypothetical protein